VIANDAIRFTVAEQLQSVRREARGAGCWSGRARHGARSRWRRLLAIEIDPDSVIVVAPSDMRSSM